MSESVGPSTGVRSLLVSYGGITSDRVNDGWCCMNPRQSDKARINRKKGHLGEPRRKASSSTHRTGRSDR